MLRVFRAGIRLIFLSPFLYRFKKLISRLLILATFCPALALPQQPQAVGNTDDSGLSANPAAVNTVAGIGQLGHLLGSDKAGIQLGGLWLGDANYLATGGT